MQTIVSSKSELLESYQKVRSHTQYLCEPLEIEDFVVQPVMDVSPLKWHLGHTTWFFETFILKPHMKGYQEFHPKYPILFNSYYISAGDRWSRENRGQLTRPTVNEVFEYRKYVDEHVERFLSGGDINDRIEEVLILGCNHEQQHQELFLYDIKRILGDNPLHPAYRKDEKKVKKVESKAEWLNVDEGIYEIGFEGDGFHFDNEEGRHKVFLHEYQISSGLVTNGEYMEFIKDGGYRNHMLWLSEAWDWVNENQIKAPRYWHQEGEEWWNYTLGGYEQVLEDDPLCHVSYYEADAFARWRGCRLPTEHEWEVACNMYSPNILSETNFVENNQFRPAQTSDFDFFGNVWEWTVSPYVAYPYYNPPEGALGEYNGKFMVNQMVLRGGSFGTSKNHIRSTYRNFFHPHLRWMFSGIRLAKHI
ncbi:ergothioneine biosynthesis protein EgtB [Ekhidna sp.]|uniref:ergothioneine biosynthesis protein EgtB n=1 Tax=Ekhidna sp. TaxID=2608089 RepID=UPI0032EB2227